MDNISEENNNKAVVQLFITVAFVVGAAANTLALWILHKSSKTRNSKHVLLLRCLAANDLVAQFGMLFLMHLKRYKVIPLYWQCFLYVWLRAFGIGSGCVALVMAVERWLALTRPFVYQSVITYQVVKKSIFILWTSAMVLTYLPLFGFGLYYNGKDCKRYRDAAEVNDVVYAYIFLIFGSSISICIVLCNISVIWELKRIGKSQHALLRRSSRSNVNNRYSTEEEISFAKLMAVVCIIFILCWMPQMVSIPMAQFYPESKFYKVFGKIADVLMCAYFALDPYVYVLQRHLRKGRCKLPCGKSSKVNKSSQSASVNGTSLTSTAINIHLHNCTPMVAPESI